MPAGASRLLVGTVIAASLLAASGAAAQPGPASQRRAEISAARVVVDLPALREAAGHTPAAPACKPPVSAARVVVDLLTASGGVAQAVSAAPMDTLRLPSPAEITSLPAADGPVARSLAAPQHRPTVAAAMVVTSLPADGEADVPALGQPDDRPAAPSHAVLASPPALDTDTTAALPEAPYRLEAPAPIGASILAPGRALAQAAPVTGHRIDVPAAADKAPTPPPMLQRMDVKVTLHKAQTINLNTPFSEALVGNAGVADIVPLTSGSLYIVGKKVGVTSLTLLDQEKRPSAVVDVEVTYDLAVLRTQLKSVGGVRVRSVNGKILLTGKAADSVAMQQALLFAEQIAPGDVTNAITVAAPQQVLLEVRFIEADRTATRALGFNSVVAGDAVVGATGLESTTGAISSNASGDLVSGLVHSLSGGLAVNATPFGAAIGRVLMGGTSADLIVKALEQRGVARRLAEPNLVALSGDTASFLAGGEFPFPVSADNDKVTVEFKKFGVGLAFTPTVLGEGQINLKIEPEVSELDPTNFIRVSDNIEIPSLIVRRASTTVELRDGQSFAVAGLLQGSNVRNHRQLPWIGDVPVLGMLLRSAAWQKRETDLVIIVTPHLVKPKVPGERLTTPLDSHVSSNDKEFFLDGLPEKQVKPAASRSGHIIDWAEDKPAAPIHKGYKQ